MVPASLVTTGDLADTCEEVSTMGEGTSPAREAHSELVRSASNEASAAVRRLLNSDFDPVTPGLLDHASHYVSKLDDALAAWESALDREPGCRA